MESRAGIIQSISDLTAIGFSKTPLFRDALIKWGFILSQLDKIENSRELRILDLGSGIGPLKQMLSRKHLVTAVDDFTDSPWFTLPKAIMQMENLDNIENLQMNVFRFFEKCDSERFDVVIDCCSSIHFYDRNSLFRFFKLFHKRKQNKVASEVSRVLKNGGCYIYVTDLSKCNQMLEMNEEIFYLRPFEEHGLDKILTYSPEFFKDLEQQSFGDCLSRVFPTTTTQSVEIVVSGGVLKKKPNRSRRRKLPRISGNIRLGFALFISNLRNKLRG